MSVKQKKASKQKNIKSSLSKTDDVSIVSGNSCVNNVAFTPPLADSWCLSFAFETSQLKLPNKLLYDNYLCTKPLKVLNLSGWRLSSQFFHSIAQDCVSLRVLNLDNAIGVTLERLECLRGHTSLTSLNLRKSISFDIPFSRLISSFPILSDLDISECSLENKSFHQLGTQCSSLRKLTCQSCPGLDDFILLDVVHLINKYHMLHIIDLSHNDRFTDEGLLAVLVAGINCIKAIDISACKGLSTLSIAGLRKKMTVLDTLDISDLTISISAFEWIPEGCVYLKNLDMSRCIELDDITLTLIGKKCRFLEKLIIERCANISDAGIIGFTNEFEGRLKRLDISGCVLCGSNSAMALSAKANELIDLRLNGLSQISSDGLRSLWNACKKLQKFEMCAELKSTAAHRRSMIPHMSDQILQGSSYTALRDVRLTGACLVTDVGACAMIRKCSDITTLDVSYCNGITDKLLVVLGTKSPQLTSLCVSGCNKIGDMGLNALAKGCRLLTRFEAAGCAKITDKGIMALKLIYKLEILNIRNCDNVTDAAMIYIAKSCYYLRVLDVTGLDMVSQVGISAITDSCRRLSSLHASSCNISPHEFSAVTRMTLPLSQPAAGRCTVEMRARDIIEYNSYILNIHDDQRKTKCLQRFVRKINGRRQRRLLHIAHEKSTRILQRCYRGHIGKIRARKLRIETDIKNNQARRLQYEMRRLMAMYYARHKLIRMRDEDRSARLLQRNYRGHMARKRVKNRINVRAYFDKCLVVLAWKAFLIFHARRLHSRIIMVQRRARYFAGRSKRRRILLAVRKLQVMVRLFYIGYRQQKARRLAQQKLDLLRLTAANTIRRNWLIRKYNNSIVHFITECGVYYSNQYATESWYATKIQTRFRGHRARVKYYRSLQLTALSNESSIRIQTTWRRYSKSSKYPAFRAFKKSITRNWRRAYRAALNFFYSRAAKTIQRLIRRYLLRIHRQRAALQIQRAYRGHRGRLRYRYYLLQKQERMARKIQRRYRVVRCRRLRHERMNREHMAAYKIQAFIRWYQAVKARRRLEAARKAKILAERQIEKELALQNRLRLAVENIYKATRDRYVMKIQRVWRNYKKKKDLMKAAEERRLALLEEAKEEIQPLGTRLANRAVDPAKRAVNALKLLATRDDRDIHPASLPKLENSILKFQTQSVAQTGIVDIKLTVGSPESNAFGQRQKFLKNTRKPHYEMVNGGDLSGALRLNVMLWAKFGSGIDCICDVKASLVPPKSTLAGLQAREKNLGAQGIQLAWHESAPFEVQGLCLLKQGKGGFAVDNLRVCRTIGECERAENEGFVLVKDMMEYNMPTSLWMHLKKQQLNFQFEHSKHMLMQDWFDSRLDIKVIQTYNMEENMIFQMRDVFERVQNWNDDEHLRSQALWRFLDLPWTELSIMVIKSINPANHDQLSFSEYCHLTCAICMLGKAEMVRMVYKHIDQDGHYLLSEEDFSDAVEFMTEGLQGQRSLRLWRSMYPKYLDIDTLSMTLTKFHDFVDHNQRVLWCFSAIQKAFWAANLGVAYWERKMKQFKKARDDLGVEILR